MSEWADRNRVLSAEASAEPGRWDTSRAEYQRGIMDAVSDPTVDTVVVMSSAQVGKTEIVNNVVAFHIDQDPAPILLLQPTLEMGQAWSKDRLAPMLRDTPCLQGRVADPRARDSGNTLLHKTFPGGHITVAGANSPASLASRPIRIVLADEVDRYPLSAGAEGDPVSLARKRTTTFWSRKVILVSTPTIAGASRIEAAYETSDKRKFFVPCPHCGGFQPLTWGQVQWTTDQPETALYACAECGALWNDGQRWAAIGKGEWRATAPFSGIAGFHLSELCSTWVRLSGMVRAFLEAKDHPEQLKTWVNTSLGETWRDKGEAPEWERLYERREEFRAVPAGALFLTGFADVQKDRLEVSVWGWGRNNESWLIEHRILDGDTSRPEVWGLLDLMTAETWRHANGVDLPLSRFGIDTGYATQEVYAWARRQRPGFVVPTKGQDSLQVPVGTPSAVDVKGDGKRVRRGVRVYPVGVSILKAELYGWLRQAMPEDGQPFPRGYVHLPKSADAEYCKQLVAEQLVTHRTGRREWQKLRECNEALDCRVGARAVAIACGVERWNEAHWATLEQQVAVKAAPPPPAPVPDPPVPPPPNPAPPLLPAAPRRNGGWMGGRKGWMR